MFSFRLHRARHPPFAKNAKDGAPDYRLFEAPDGMGYPTAYARLTEGQDCFAVGWIHEDQPEKETTKVNVLADDNRLS